MPFPSSKEIEAVNTVRPLSSSHQSCEAGEAERYIILTPRLHRELHVWLRRGWNPSFLSPSPHFDHYTMLALLYGPTLAVTVLTERAEIIQPSR